MALIYLGFRNTRVEHIRLMLTLGGLEFGNNYVDLRMGKSLWNQTPAPFDHGNQDGEFLTAEHE